MPAQRWTSLTLQAMGLGGWMFTGLNAATFMGALAGSGVPGLGVRFVEDPRWASPNPVGIDGVFESIAPPYVADMAAAVEEFVARKFGPGGTYDRTRAGPFLDNARVRGAVAPYSPELRDMLVEVSRYIVSAYGRFPGTTATLYMRAFAQAHHLDLRYYDQFYGSDSYLQTHRDHFANWHAGEPR